MREYVSGHRVHLKNCEWFITTLSQNTSVVEIRRQRLHIWRLSLNTLCGVVMAGCHAGIDGAVGFQVGSQVGFPIFRLSTFRNRPESPEP